MPLKVVFMGTPDFAVPTLAEIVGGGHEVVAVYTSRAGGRWPAARRPPAPRSRRRGCGSGPAPGRAGYAPGVGLAGIQIGEAVRIVTIDTSKEKEDRKPLVRADRRRDLAQARVRQDDEGTDAHSGASKVGGPGAAAAHPDRRGGAHRHHRHL
jgi:hypothetical protein